MKKSVLILFTLVANVLAEWPTPWSGSLRNPVLFVHGISSDMGTWGAMSASKVCKSPTGTLSTPTTYRGYVSTWNVTIKCQDGTSRIGGSVAGDSRTFNPNPFLAKTIADWTNKAYLPLTESYRNGWVRGYKDNSAALILAQKYGIDAAGGLNFSIAAAATQVDSKEINHNGLEFYTSVNPDNHQPAPFAWIDKTSPDILTKSNNIREENQPSQLYRRMTEVLDEYYSDWKVNPDRVIDLVCHSQGGLVVRGVIMYNRSTSLENPVNHIRSIVTLDTPHLGTAIASDKSGLPNVDKLREYVYGFGNELSISDMIYGVTELGPYYIKMPQSNGIIGYRFMNQQRPDGTVYTPGFYYVKNEISNPRGWTAMRVDPLEAARSAFSDFTSTDINLAYPYNYSNSDWIPAGVNWAPPSGTQRSTFITSLMQNGYPKAPYNGRRIPMTAYHGFMDPGAIDKMVDIAINKAYETCDGTADNVSAWLAPTVNILTSFFTLGLSGTDFKACWQYVDQLGPIIRQKVHPYDAEWGETSDLAVDISSQQAAKIFRPTDPFRMKRLRKKRDSDIGVPHMDIAGVGENGTPLQGATSHGDEIYEALNNPPSALSLEPMLALLL